MTDIPIMFSPPMIKALLVGQKTQTRRLAFADNWTLPDREARPLPEHQAKRRPSPWVKVRPGDRLWVRENLERAIGEAVGYPADGSWLPHTPWAWKNSRLPAIHMPRSLSRFVLMVEQVRIQRLHDITEEDAHAEGAEPDMSRERDAPTYRAGFVQLWENLHGERGWLINPEVVALTFRTVRGNIDAVQEAA